MEIEKYILFTPFSAMSECNRNEKWEGRFRIPVRFVTVTSAKTRKTGMNSDHPPARS